MKLLGVISVAALVASLLHAELKWGPDYTKTFSRLVARRRSSIVYYFVVFAVFLSAFSVFMVTSFIPQYHLSELFTWIYFIGVASQVVCVTVPETGGHKTNIHLFAAGVMSVSALLQIAFLVCFAHLSIWSFIICSLSLCIMLMIWLIVIVKHHFVTYELGLQSVYFASYFGALLFVSYIG